MSWAGWSIASGVQVCFVPLVSLDDKKQKQGVRFSLLFFILFNFLPPPSGNKERTNCRVLPVAIWDPSAEPHVNSGGACCVDQV